MKIDKVKMLQLAKENLGELYEIQEQLTVLKAEQNAKKAEERERAKDRYIESKVGTLYNNCFYAVQLAHKKARGAELEDWELEFDALATDHAEKTKDKKHLGDTTILKFAHWLKQAA